MIIYEEEEEEEEQYNAKTQKYEWQSSFVKVGEV